jgi:serine phosphatase RsbU (regulator of sigma subunit)
MKNKFNYIVSNTYLCIFVSSIVLILLAVVDWLTGYEFSFQFFYFIPLTIFSFNNKFNKGSILLFAFITSLVWFLADYFAQHVYSDLFLYFWNTMSRLIVFSTFSLFLNSIIKHRFKIDLLNTELLKKELVVTDSIKYAKTIQDSIIPSFSGFNKIFPSSFILNKPKDILSGDFFWYYKYEGKVFFALADCTGHGIPGSLLSVIGNILIHRVIIDKEISNPSNILENLHDELVHVFSVGNEHIDDGMEISLVVFDESKSEICISQTSQGLILVNTDGSMKLFETNGFTVGGILSKRKGANYTSETIKIEKGAWLYLFTDGYIDQFGSEENIKFGIHNFIELLKNAHNSSCSEQLNLLNDTIENWKGDFKQIDDITIAGIEF